MVEISELKFDSNGLIPAVVVDSITKKVLTVAYMNAESLEIAMKKGLTCFFSRSRQQLWLKGETSGNYQHIVSITADCDKDALVVVVEKDGPACHTGNESCFFNPFIRAGNAASSACRDFTICSRTARKCTRRVRTHPTSLRRV